MLSDFFPLFFAGLRYAERAGQPVPVRGHQLPRNVHQVPTYEP